MKILQENLEANDRFISAFLERIYVILVFFRRECFHRRIILKRIAALLLVMPANAGIQNWTRNYF